MIKIWVVIVLVVNAYQSVTFQGVTAPDVIKPSISTEPDLVIKHPSNITLFKQWSRNDTTKKQEYTVSYYCWHFTQDYAKNASLAGWDVGVLGLGQNQGMTGYQNHVMNYIIIDGNLVIIEPQTGHMWTTGMLRGDSTGWYYYKMYQNYTDVPNRYNYQKADGVISDLPPTVKGYSTNWYGD